MENNLDELLEHLDYFYDYVKSDYDSDRKFEVYLKEGQWTITDSANGNIFGTPDNKRVMEYLVENNADLLTFHGLVHSAICTEGVLRRMQLKKVELLVGKESLDKSEEAFDAFAKSLGAAVKSQFSDKPKLGLV